MSSYVGRSVQRAGCGNNRVIVVVPDGVHRLGWCCRSTVAVECCVCRLCAVKLITCGMFRYSYALTSVLRSFDVTHPVTAPPVVVHCCCLHRRSPACRHQSGKFSLRKQSPEFHLPKTSVFLGNYIRLGATPIC